MSIIATALEFLHARRWLVELLLALAVIGALAAYRAHLIHVGELRADAKYEAAAAKAQAAADAKTAQLKQQAEAANHAYNQEVADFNLYRVQHPIGHGLLCPRAASSGVPTTGAADSRNGSASAPSGNVQPVYPGDHSGDGQADQLGMLDLLAGRADAVSAQLREWQARQ